LCKHNAGDFVFVIARSNSASRHARNRFGSTLNRQFILMTVP
jgi:hypothetical protein